MKKRNLFAGLILAGLFIGLTACSGGAPAAETPNISQNGIPQGDNITAVPLPPPGTELPGFIAITEDVAQLPLSSCQPAAEGTKQFTFELPSANIGYCFLYPNDFNTVDSDIPGIVQFAGPPRNASTGPVSASMNVYVHPAGGNNLQGFVQNQLTGLPAGTSVTPMETTLGSGSPAIVLEGWPGPLLSRHVFTEKNGYIYQLVFFPADPAAPEAQADIQRFFDTVRQTWVFTR